MPAQPATVPIKSISLVAAGLSCVRGDRTLFSDLDLELVAGECLHVIGANGCGKTSLLRILVGISRPETGFVAWCGVPIHDDSDFYKVNAYIGHKDGLKDELTTAENLSFYQQLQGRCNNQRVDDDLAYLGILECADLTANKLSFGQRRRLAFARLLQGKFKLWILDEPFTGIDDQGRDLIESICVEHLQHGGMIILTNHHCLAHSRLADSLRELKL